MKIGVLLYTYNRTDDARINMEIIRNVWSMHDAFKEVTIVHSYNGKREWWPEKYLEDELLYLDNPGHFLGAELLLNEGMRCFSEKYSDIDYVITLASDTWLTKPEYLARVLATLQGEEKYLATCPWGTVEKDNMWKIGMALDFNIVDLRWAIRSRLFPIRFAEFVEKHEELFHYHDEIIFPERVFAVRFKEAILRSVAVPSENLFKQIFNAHVYRMTEREPVHDEKKLFGIKKGRRMYWPAIGLLTHHEPEPKRDILLKLELPLGEHGRTLLSASDLSYYNNGITKTQYVKGKERFDYND